MEAVQVTEEVEAVVTDAHLLAVHTDPVLPLRMAQAKEAHHLHDHLPLALEVAAAVEVVAAIVELVPQQAT